MVHMAPNGKDLKGLNGFKLVNKKRSKWGNMGSKLELQMGPHGHIGFKWVL